MNTLQYPLYLVGWWGSQVTENAQALEGTVNIASLNSIADQVGSRVFCIQLLNEFLI